MKLNEIEIPFADKNKFSIEIKRSSDSIKLLYLTFESNKIKSVDEFKQLMKNDSLNINNQWITYDFELLMELTEVKKFDDSYIVTIPGNYTIGEFYQIASQHNIFNIYFDIKNIHMIDKIKICYEMNYYSDNIRKELCDKHQERIFQTITPLINHHIDSNHIDTDTHIYNCCPNRIAKGYFILGDLNLIELLKIQLNGQDRLKLNNVQLNMICHKISDKLHYFSFNNKNNYRDMTYESYDGSSNNFRIDTLKFCLKFKKSKYTDSSIKIYELELNIFRYMNGICGIFFPDQTTLINQSVKKIESTDNLEYNWSTR